MAYIGVDVGTSGCKAGVVDAQGNLLALARQDYSLVHPHAGWVELDPKVVWHCVEQVLAELAPQAAGVTHLAVSSIGESLVLADGRDRVLCNGVVYLDTRCAWIPDLLRRHWDDETWLEHTGLAPNQMFSLNQLLWYGRNAPEMMAQVRKAFMFGEYVGYRLCGRRMLDPSTASRTMMLDVQRLDWSGAVMDAFGVERGWFAPVLPPGLVGDGIGFEPFPGGHYFISAVQLTHGTSLRWFVNLMGEKLAAQPNPEGLARYQLADRLCPTDAGRVFFLPFMSDVDFSGDGHGLGGCFCGLDVATGWETMYRAILEGLCFESLWRVKQAGIASKAPCRVVATGGVSASPLYMQMKADVLRVPVQVLENTEAGIRGLAMLCAVAQGAYAGLPEAAAGMARASETYAPCRDYSARYEQYKMLRAAAGQAGRTIGGER